MAEELRLELLGGMRLTHNGVLLATFVSSKVPALLCYLAVTRQAHARTSLAGLLWSDLPEDAARRNLRVVLFDLRHLLAPFVTITRHTVAFNRTSSYWLDVEQLDNVLGDTTSIHIHQLHAAMTLYTGDFLRGVYIRDAPLFDEWATLQRERLHRRVVHVLHELVEAYVARKEFARGIDACTRLLHLDPWREDAHRHLMLLLAHSGQRDAALAQYQACRQMLINEFGAKPSPETTALYEQIRAGVIALPVAAEPPHVHIPLPPTPLLGRIQELAQLRQLLLQPDCRLLTLMGLGGMGKTRLALELARSQLHAFADGVVVVPLASVTDAAMIAPTIATTLSITVTHDPQQALLRTISDKQLLLVLDNCEHLMDGVTLVVAILQAAPRVVIVVTSRERLNVRGEYVYPLHGLAYTSDQGALVPTLPAVALFVQSVQRVQPNLALHADQLDTVVRICALLQGMPLGIELAAAWAETLPLDVILREITNNIDFLTSEWRDIPERQRSMRAVFEWSWRLLSGAEREVLGKLAVFRGGFTREAATTITGATLAQLTRLVQKSLIHWVTDDAPGRYEMHELLRQFAAEQLARVLADHTAVATQHSDFYLQLVAQQQAHLEGTQQQQALSVIRSEIGNVRQAWLWAASHKHIETLDASAFGLWLFFVVSGSNTEAEQAFHSVADSIQAGLHELESTHATQAHRRVASKLLAIRGHTLAYSGKFEQALAIAPQARMLGAASIDTETEMVIALLEGHTLMRQPNVARASLEHAIQLAQPRHTSSVMACFVAWNALVFVGWLDQQQNDYTSARQHYEQGLRICHESESMRGSVILLSALAGLDVFEGNYQSARQQYEQSWQLAHSIQNRWAEALSQLELGGVMRRIGQYGRALELIEQAGIMLRNIGDDLRHTQATVALGRLFALMGDYEQAHARLDSYLNLGQSLQGHDLVSDGLTSLALLAYHTEEYHQALTYAEQAQQIAQGIGNRLNDARSLLVIGHVRAGLGQLADAAIAYQQALMLLAMIGNRLIAVEAQAGLAWLALTHGDVAAATDHIEAILEALVDHPHVGLDEPFYTYLVCYRVLQALDDPRAEQVLHTAQHVLQTYAECIDDPALRRSFLENVAIHRELLHPDRESR